MRLLILNQFFYPDHSAISQLMTDLAESLVERGLSVTALSGRGLYNGGKTLPPREEYRGVRVERAWATSFGKRSVAGRLADYFTFYLGAAWKLLTLPRHDVVMALTLPPLIGLLALFACRLRGMRLVALVEDIYPDVGVALGTFREGGLLARLLDRLNRLVLRRADRVIVLGDCMRERVMDKIHDASEERIDIIHNWADGEKIRPLAAGERNSFAEEQELGQRFVVQFSGNFGMVNDFDTPLEAARLLRNRADIIFLFIGDGVKAGEIKEFVSRHDLANVRVLPYQSRENLLYSLAAGHAHLVTLADGLAGLSVPSKTYGILAAGRPVIFVGDPRSDIARLVAEHGCGAVVRTGEAMRLASIITAWADDPAALATLGDEGRALFSRRFDRPQAVAAYAESLSKSLSPPLRDRRV
ncbi:MAG TPA: glycosyltransferase family 4 protein [Pyrinomonadaceae bacterium]|nr:glycosyltransferase family 4 protein [Pyrinomonadaceae bacterium]